MTTFIATIAIIFWLILFVYMAVGWIFMSEIEDLWK